MDSCIKNISCIYKEYRLKDNKWIKTVDDKYSCDSNTIKNMQDCSIYYSELGGYMSIDCKKNRRFGIVVSKIVSVSICGAVKKIFSFDYNLARNI